MANVSDVAGKYKISGPDIERLGYKKIALFLKDFQNYQSSFIEYGIFFGNFSSYTDEEINNMTEEDAKKLLTKDDYFTASGRWAFSICNLKWFSTDPKYLEFYRKHNLKDLVIELYYDEIEPGAAFIEADSYARINILYNDESDEYGASINIDNHVYELGEEGLRKMKYLENGELTYYWSYLPIDQLTHEQIKFFLDEGWLESYVEDEGLEFKDGILYIDGKPCVTKRQLELDESKEF